MKILIIKPSSFGDIIQANPVVAALREAYPAAEISWVVFAAWKGVAQLFTGIDRWYIWDRAGGLAAYCRLIGVLRAARFDLVIDLQGLARSAVVARLCGARRVIGVPGMKELSWLLVTEAYPASRSLNAALRSLETVRLLTGKTYAPRFSLAVPQAAVSEAAQVLSGRGWKGEALIGLVPFARGAGKEWPLEHYGTLISRCAERFPGMRCVIVGGQQDAGKWSDTRCSDLCGALSFAGLAAVLQKCRVVIGSDTGPAHLAAALQTPTVMLFGGSDVTETAPAAGRVTVISKKYPCSPCRGRGTCSGYPCLAAITPDEVFSAVSLWMQ